MYGSGVAVGEGGQKGVGGILVNSQFKRFPFDYLTKTIKYYILENLISSHCLHFRAWFRAIYALNLTFAKTRKL